ncbi:hypothetical protein ACFUCV_02875 [Specibacter sp. NPDC057265]|uniref:hypothetical protein n=1 Tax=Specibacter sp. NPDC057265 TaxID=3346075 RepID=UPI00364151A2
MGSYEDNSEFFQKLYAEMQAEEDMKGRAEELKRRCPSSGEKVGIMLESLVSNDWYIKCPACGMQWAGGSIVLSEHNKPGYR